MKQLKILVTGSKGQLGSEFRRLAKDFNKLDFTFTDIDELDISKPDDIINYTERLKPDYIINCAGYTAVDRAETDSEKAMNLNANAVKNIIAAIEESRCKLVHISTDYVLSGVPGSPLSEEDNPDPRSVYAKSKLEGEKYALQHKNTLVIRTSWLYSEYGHNFVKTILRLAVEREEISVVNDQVGSPTWAADLAIAIIKIINSVAAGTTDFISGIYHYSNMGSCSWYEFARRIIDIKGLSLKIKPVSTDEYPLPAYRPAYSVMSKNKIIKRYSLIIPGWEDSLVKCLKLIDQQ